MMDTPDERHPIDAVPRALRALLAAGSSARHDSLHLPVELERAGALAGAEGGHVSLPSLPASDRQRTTHQRCARPWPRVWPDAQRGRGQCRSGRARSRWWPPHPRHGRERADAIRVRGHRRRGKSRDGTHNPSRSRGRSCSRGRSRSPNPYVLQARAAMESGVTASFKNTAASNHHEVHTHSLPMARELLRHRLPA